MAARETCREVGSMTTKAELEHQLGRRLRSDADVIDDEVVRVDPSGTIVERFEAGKGNGVYLPAPTTSILTPTRRNAPGMQSAREQEIGPPPALEPSRDPDTIPLDHPHHVEPRSARSNPNALYGNHRVKIVDGLATEYVDEKGPSSPGSSEGMRIVG